MIQLINREQVNQTATYFYNGKPVYFDKNKGHSFSEEEATPQLIRFFVKCKGCELVKEKKPFFGNQTPKKEEKTSNKDFKKESKKEETKVLQEPKLEVKKDIKEE